MYVLTSPLANIFYQNKITKNKKNKTKKTRNRIKYKNIISNFVSRLNTHLLRPNLQYFLRDRC